MTTATLPTDPSSAAPDDVVELHRHTLDKLLIGVGAILTVVLLAAGGLLMWGATFANDYVHDELTSQNVFFPDAAALKEEGRNDLVEHAGEQVSTGSQAQAYASYIAGHLKGIADGKTYSEIDDRGAAAAVVEAKSSGASAEEIAKLQATSDQLSAQRDTLFKGETLRGLLLTSYAWSTIGMIAMIAAWVAFAAGVAMFVLVVLGLVHLRRQRAIA